MNARRVLYLTGTRADFGLMRSTLQRIAAHPALSLQLAVTGMHLSVQYGLTVREIEAAGLPIAARIPSDVDSRSGEGMAVAVGQTVIGMARALRDTRPDVLLLLGDRGEMLAGAIAGLHMGCVVAHLHGGERSGTVDEPMRHAISKLAHWHLVATQQSRERLLRMGEKDEQVWVTGAPSLDGLSELGEQPREEVLSTLGLEAGDRFLIVLFHPVVQQQAQAFGQTQALMQAVLRAAGGRRILWLAPNADAGSGEILAALQSQDGHRIQRIAHLPRSDYAAALRHADLLVGNSSSGIIEAATFGTPVVNVGDRQRERERNANVLDCEAAESAIEQAVAAALARGRLAPGNVYGDGRAGPRIVERLATEPISPALLHKINCY